MKIIVTFSGGKDSLASLLWTRENIAKDFTTVFCDTGWEHPLTYKYIDEIRRKLGLNLVTLRSKKYEGMVDLSARKKRWPSSQRRFCTSELKTIPMIDYLLDEVKDDFIVIQGIRAAESASRAQMQTQCTYFKYYTHPYGMDKNGKPKYHTYRRREILSFVKQHADDVLRPVFDWSGQQVIDYILSKGLEPNPLLQARRMLSVYHGFATGYSEHFPARPAEDRLHRPERSRITYFVLRAGQNTVRVLQGRLSGIGRCGEVRAGQERDWGFVRGRYGDFLHELLRIVRMIKQ